MIFPCKNTVLIKSGIVLDRIFDDAILFDNLIDGVLDLSKVLLLGLWFNVG